MRYEFIFIKFTSPLNPPILGDFELQPPSGLGGREAIQAKIGTVQTPSEHLFEPEIWIVDEAGLLSARDAHALLMKAEAQQARVILVGDTRQLSAVEAGNPFRSLQAAGIQTVYLQESRRQKTQALKTAVDWMSQGRMAEGLQVLAQGGAIAAVQNADKRLTQLVQDYLNGSPEEQKQTLLLATTNQERLAIAARLREALQGEGRLGSNQVTLDALRSRDLTSIQAQYAACYRIGDVLVPSQDYKRQGLQKAKQYAVVQVDWRANQLVLETPEKQLIRVNPAACDRKSVYQVQQLPVAQGDRLRWTRNQRAAGIRNGQVMTVEQVDATGTAWIFADDGRRIQVDLNERQYLDYAWVSTVYGSQGKTAERVLAAIDGVISREGLYVMASRARSELTLYTGDRAELMRRASVSRAKENPSDYISLIQGRYDDGQTAQIPVESTTVGADARGVAECVGSRVGQKLTAAFCRGGGVESTHRAIGTDNRAVESRLAPELEPLSTAIAGAVARRQLNQCVGEFAAAVEAVNFGVESLE
ncbi:MAG: AAA family ATPase, partial [Cyanobacteria bacterium J06659_2]